MQTRPNRNVTSQSGANDKPIPPRGRNALAKRVTWAERDPHEANPTQPGRVLSADHPVRH